MTEQASLSNVLRKVNFKGLTFGFLLIEGKLFQRTESDGFIIPLKSRYENPFTIWKFKVVISTKCSQYEEERETILHFIFS